MPKTNVFKEIIWPTLVLIIISAVIGGLLAVTYNLTGVADLSGAGLSKEELDQYMPNVLPGGTSLKLAKTSLEDPDFLGAYVDEGGNGVAIYAQTKGYHEALKVLVGIGPDGKVTGTQIIDNQETPGLGSKIENPDFSGQFIGKDANFTVAVDGGDVNAIAGATISSVAMGDGIKKAFTFYDQIKGELSGE